MKAFIHQPHFLPWIPYFSRALAADVIVFLDSARYSEGFFHNRTVVLDSVGKAHWLGLPVTKRNGWQLNEVSVTDSRRLKKASGLVRNIYGGTAQFDQVEKFADMIQTSEGITLASINVLIFNEILSAMGVEQRRIILASSLSTSSDRTQRIVSMCRDLAITEVLTGWGNFSATHDVDDILSAGLVVWRQDRNATLAELHRLSDQRPAGLSILHDLAMHGPKKVLEAIERIGTSSFKKLTGRSQHD
jgi:hypothetical protein